MSSHHCARGKELLVDLQRAEWLPAYDEEGIRTVCKEINDMWTALESIEDSADPDNDSLALYFNKCSTRNRKYLFGYFLHRLERIRNTRFTHGTMLPEPLSEKLSTQENEYFASYNRIMNTYNSQLGIDISSKLVPPKELSISVKVITDCGEIMTDYGPVKLEAGARVFIKRSPHMRTCCFVFACLVDAMCVDRRSSI